MRIFQGIKKKMVIYMIAQSPLSRQDSAPVIIAPRESL